MANDTREFRPESHLELTETGDGFHVWLFDYQIGSGATIELAMEDAQRAVRSWRSEE